MTTYHLIRVQVLGPLLEQNPFSNSQYLPYIFKNFLRSPGFVAAKCPRTLALDPVVSVPSKSGLNSRVEGTYPGVQTQIFGEQGGLEGGVEGSARVGHQPVYNKKKQASAAHDSYGKRIPPCHNTIGERKQSIWAGPPVGNFHSYVFGPRSEMVFRAACWHLP